MDLAKLRQLLINQEKSYEVMKQVLAKLGLEIQTLKKQISEADKVNFLEVVSENFKMTPYKESQIKRRANQFVSSGWKVREQRLNQLRSECRKATIEVVLKKEANQFLVKIVKQNKIFDELAVAKWDSYGVRRLIDNSKGMKVPWTLINKGETWKEDIELSEYYLDRKWISQNIVRFPTISQK